MILVGMVIFAFQLLKNEDEVLLHKHIPLHLDIRGPFRSTKMLW